MFCVIDSSVQERGAGTMGDGSGHALAHGEGVAAHKVCPGRIGVVQCVEEERRGGREQVPDVLLQRVDVLARRILRHKAVVVDGVDILVALGNLHACSRTFRFQIQAGPRERVRHIDGAVTSSQCTYHVAKAAAG